MHPQAGQSSLEAFHPLVRSWFEDTYRIPTEVQRRGWEAIARGGDALLAAPTGSGKTLAAFLFFVQKLVRAAAEGELEDRTYVVYVSPIKALGNDIERNLQAPLSALSRRATENGLALAPIRVAVRSGDTPADERRRQLRRPPHILITTPESLYILLTAEGSRTILSGAEAVIVDEIHALAGDKRGAHLALSLERLDRLCGRPIQRVGLSATQRPIERVARLLVGKGRLGPGDLPRCTLVNEGHKRALELSIEVPDDELSHLATHELRAKVYDRIAALIRAHRTTLVFVNTRRLVERVALALSERLGENTVSAHHGSLSREVRFAAEQALKAGDISAMVATASLELGIDVGHVDLVVHLGAPRAIATLLQRVGRSGHFLAGTPKGILFPLTRDELMQCAATLRAVGEGELDEVSPAPMALDILAQQMSAIASAEDIEEEELFELVRRAYPYESLSRKTYQDVLTMLSEGIATRRGRRSALVHHDAVGHRIRGRRGTRLLAMTSGGAIADMADYDVIEDPSGALVGKVNEDFAIESMAGDVFLLGNRPLRIRRVESGRVRVEDATGKTPTIPFWLGEAPARTKELSRAVSQLREDLATRLAADPKAAAAWAMQACALSEDAATQVCAYVADNVRVLGEVPSTHCMVLERFFDEAGGMQLVVHAPFGGRINRALGFALRKRFCVSFDFELQAAATDDGVVLSLGEQHSFALDSVMSMLRKERVEADLAQAVLRSPMFVNRFRWNATRSLAIARMQSGKKVPIFLQRMRAEDLMAAVFPGQVACQDNHGGPVDIPQHPLVDETIHNCFHEAMDLPGLLEVLEGVKEGTIRVATVETPSPSPFSHEILNANPYAFLDDAPLEERRARAVSLRRVDPSLSEGVGALDQEAIATVRRQAWPDPRNPDEVHDALLSLWILPERDAEPWRSWMSELERAGRARSVMRDGRRYFVAEERVSGADTLSFRMLQGWLDVLGPVTAEELARRLGFPVHDVDGSLLLLEAQGTVLRGSFTVPKPSAVEWCERGLLARIHRLTLGKLRREIEAVSPSDFLRYLFRHQHVAPGTKLHGLEGLREIVRILEGFEVPGPAWELSVFPARIEAYDSTLLSDVCLSGEVVWGRLRLMKEAGNDMPKRRVSLTRQVPLAWMFREHLDDVLHPGEGVSLHGLASPLAARAYESLRDRGAQFLVDLARALSELPTRVEEALWELVTLGLVTGDGVTGLRTLLLPESKRAPHARLRLIPRERRSLPLGRWSILRDVERENPTDAHRAEKVARRLLVRYGVVFRELAARERLEVPFREVLFALRRLEAKGEVRGGRFVDGFVGEQFAFPSAVEALRAVRRLPEEREPIMLSAADPLNLGGILTPGERVSAHSSETLVFQNGVPVTVAPLGRVRSAFLASQKVEKGEEDEPRVSI